MELDVVRGPSQKPGVIVSGENDESGAMLKRVIDDVHDLNKTLKDEYVLLVVFDGHKQYMDQRMKPLERLVYGLVGLVLAGFVSALIALVITTN